MPVVPVVGLSQAREQGRIERSPSRKRLFVRLVAYGYIHQLAPVACHSTPDEEVTGFPVLVEAVLLPFLVESHSSADASSKGSVNYREFPVIAIINLAGSRQNHRPEESVGKRHGILMRQRVYEPLYGKLPYGGVDFVFRGVHHIVDGGFHGSGSVCIWIELGVRDCTA